MTVLYLLNTSSRWECFSSKQPLLNRDILASQHALRKGIALDEKIPKGCGNIGISVAKGTVLNLQCGLFIFFLKFINYFRGEMMSCLMVLSRLSQQIQSRL